MGTIASQITSLTNVYSTIYSGADQIKQTGEFPAQMVSNAENVSIWLRHQEINDLLIYGMNKYLQPHKRRNLIKHPCPDFNGDLGELSLKLRHGWIITYI